MALGALTLIDHVAAVGPVIHARATIVGDGTYATGGSLGLLAKLKAALGGADVAIIAANPTGENNGYAPVYTPSSDLLKVYFNDNNNASDGPAIEDTTADQSGRTYTLYIVAK